MLLGGLWHGSSWNFIIWGAIHGIVLGIEKFLKSKGYLDKVKGLGFLGYPITFCIVLLSWVFFRAQDLHSASLAIRKIFQFNLGMPLIGNMSVMATSIFVLTIGIVFDLYLFNKKIDLEVLGAKFSSVKIAVVATVIITLINLFYSSSNNFIYFQF